MTLTLDLCNDDGLEVPLTEDEMLSVCERVLAEEGVTRPCFISLTLVTDEEMRTQNARWRGIDAATDVISLECERPDDPDLADGEPCELGDILLAPAYIERQAKGFGVSWADEFCLLLIHGMLHLLGYDHIQEDEALVMEAREDELLALVVGGDSAAHVALTRHREGEDA